MTSVEFCYWLQGLFEVGKPETLNAEQTQQIKDHLSLVFYHEIDKKYEDKEKAQRVHRSRGSLEDIGPIMC